MDRELRVTAHGYRLSPRAAALEEKWNLERKDIIVSGFAGVATANRDDFATNRVSLQRYADGVAAGDGNLQGLAAAGACVSFWSGNIAGLPLHVTRKINGIDTPDPAHPLYWLLHDSPNYDQSAFDFWEYMVDSLEWRGNAYAQMGHTDAGLLISLTPIRPDLVSVRRLASGDLEYRWTIAGTTTIVGSRDVLHIRGRGGDALGGASTLATYRKALGLAATTEASADTIFRNGVRTSGTLGMEKMLLKDQRDELEARLQEKFVGSQNAGRPMLLDGGLKWEKVAIDPVDAEMIESRKFNMVIVCQIFEVDPHLVGITDGNTQLGSSITDQTLSLVKFKMHKRLKRIEGALEKQLLSRADRKSGVNIRFNLEGFLRADSQGRAQFYQTMTQIGAMTINEVRALEGLPPVPGGDVPRVQMQNQPIDAAPGGLGVAA